MKESRERQLAEGSREGSHKRDKHLRASLFSSGYGGIIPSGYQHCQGIADERFVRAYVGRAGRPDQWENYVKREILQSGVFYGLTGRVFGRSRRIFNRET